MMSLLQDVGYALRGLRKSPGFTATAILTLALGVGANTAIFSVTNSVLLRPHRFRDLDRLVVLREQTRGHAGEQKRLTAADTADLAQAPNLFQEVAAYQYRQLNLARNGEADSATAFLITPNMFNLLGVAPEQGRSFSAGDGQAGHDDVLLLSHSFWQRRFGGDPSIVGSTITVDGHNATIAGVMPRDLNYPPGVEVWKPLSLTSEAKANRANETVFVVARLAAAVSLDQARSELNTIAARLELDYRNTNAGRTFSLVRLREEQWSETAPLLLLLQTGAFFLLLLACANLGVLVPTDHNDAKTAAAPADIENSSASDTNNCSRRRRDAPSAVRTASSRRRPIKRIRTIRNSLSANYTRWVAGWIYGVVGHAVAQSNREFGIRMALGAARSDVLALVAGRALRTTAVGLALGMLFALTLARLSRTLLFGVIELRASVFVGFALLLFAIAGVAALLPARRASRVDPMIALRQE